MRAWVKNNLQSTARKKENSKNIERTQKCRIERNMAINKTFL